MNIDNSLSSTGAASGALTLTIPPTTGQRIAVDKVVVTQYAGSAVSATGTPTFITNTNLVGSLSFLVQTGALGQGAVERILYEFGSSPWLAQTQSSTVTFVAPALTNVTWHLAAWWHLTE